MKLAPNYIQYGDYVRRRPHAGQLVTATSRSFLFGNSKPSLGKIGSILKKKSKTTKRFTCYSVGRHSCLLSPLYKGLGHSRYHCGSDTERQCQPPYSSSSSACIGIRSTACRSRKHSANAPHTHGGC